MCALLTFNNHTIRKGTRQQETPYRNIRIGLRNYFWNFLLVAKNWSIWKTAQFSRSNVFKQPYLQAGYKLTHNIMVKHTPVVCDIVQSSRKISSAVKDQSTRRFEKSPAHGFWRSSKITSAPIDLHWRNKICANSTKAKLASIDLST